MPNCPNCKRKLEDNKEHYEGTKPSADWFCPYCFCDDENREYVFYDSEVT